MDSKLLDIVLGNKVLDLTPKEEISKGHYIKLIVAFVQQNEMSMSRIEEII